MDEIIKVDTIDKCSKRLLANDIELLLGYCMSFYGRSSIRVRKRTGIFWFGWRICWMIIFKGGNPESYGYPTVKYFAERVFLSPNYFGGLIMKETGQTAQWHIVCISL